MRGYTGQRDVAASSRRTDRPVNDYVRSLLRFWWVIVIGLVVAPAAAIMAVYNVDFSSCPVADRALEAELLGSGTAARHGQRPAAPAHSVTTLQAVAADAEGTPRLLPVTSAPDTATLVQAANLYPSFIESDPVAEIREEHVRRNDGRAAGAGALRGLEPEPVHAVARPGDPADRRRRHAEEGDRPRHAHEHRVHQMDDAEPAAGGDRPRQRITVVPLQTPQAAAAFGGASSTLPVLVFGVVLMAFVALALLFDRMFPRRAKRSAPASRDSARAGADERVTARTTRRRTPWRTPSRQLRAECCRSRSSRAASAFLVAVLPLGGKAALAGGVVFLLAVVIALADTAKPVFTWPNMIAALVLVIWFVPIKLYALPIELPFNLEPYRLFLLALVFALGDADRRAAADGWTRPAGAGAILLLIGVAIVSTIVNFDTLQRDGRRVAGQPRRSTSSASCSSSCSSPRRSTGCRTSIRSCGCSSSARPSSRCSRSTRRAPGTTSSTTSASSCRSSTSRSAR